MKESPILLFLTPEDMSYIQHFKPFVMGRQANFITQTPSTYSEIEIYAKSKGIKFIISTNVAVLNKVVIAPFHQNLNNWQGSLFERAGITYLFLNPFKQLFSVPYGSYITKRFTSKLVSPKDWTRTPEFTYDVANPENIDQWYNRFSKAILSAMDIETKSWEDGNGEYRTLIRCICFTGLWEDGTIHTLVIPIGEAPDEQLLFWVSWMRKFSSLPCPKIFQNGLYDTGHMLCYNSPVNNYLFDTQSMFHAWLSELPKRLDFISAFLTHNSYYWKDLGATGKLEDLFKYNALDGWATMCGFLQLLKEMPDWAIKNYLIKFPLMVPCCYMNLEGVAIDEQERERLINEYKTAFEVSLARLHTFFGEGFNPNSPTQVVKLIQFYGSIDIHTSERPDIEKFALRHPLNGRIAREILKVRETSKIISTYLKPKDYTTAVTKSTKKKTYLLRDGRMFYAHNPDGTDTGRLSCKESIFWTGSQVQNQPEETKGMWRCDNGFILFEADFETSESYCTGYSSGDRNLLDALLSGRDFHATNAERFFGISYEQIVDINNKKIVLNKELRNLSKRTNHGATYDMMWFTLLVTMGEENVDRAKLLLKLPPYWTRRKVCEYLLEAYDKAYPTVRTNWYDAITTIVNTCKMLTSALGWTRLCFGNPSKSKREKDSLIAHVPQNLSVGLINEGIKEVFWKIQTPNSKNLRLKAQVHDSLLGQVRIGHEDFLLPQIIQTLTRPTKVKDLVKGVERIMTIPVSMKVGQTWANMKTYNPPK